MQKWTSCRCWLISFHCVKLNKLHLFKFVDMCYPFEIRHCLWSGFGTTQIISTINPAHGLLSQIMMFRALSGYYSMSIVIPFSMFHHVHRLKDEDHSKCILYKKTCYIKNICWSAQMNTYVIWWIIWVITVWDLMHYDKVIIQFPPLWWHMLLCLHITVHVYITCQSHALIFIG